MATILRHEPKCLVKNSNKGTMVEAEVMDFDFQKKMTVVINKSVKIGMVWNGKLYEGRAAGLDFLSDGPALKRTNTGSRG